MFTDMKKSFLMMIAVLTALIFGVDTVRAKDKIIEMPVFTARNTDAIAVSRIVLGDTATVLRICANYYPDDWIKIDKNATLTDNTGRKYALRGGEGITPGKKLTIPASGEAEFSLIFEPVDAKAKTVTFAEGDVSKGGWAVFDIRLDGAKTLPAPKLPVGFVAHKTDKNTALPMPGFDYGVATVKGRILDNRPGLAKTISYNPRSVFRTYNTRPETLPVAADGTFSFSVPVAGITALEVYSSFEKPTLVFVEPGKTTELCINLREYARRESKYHKHTKQRGLPVYVNGPMAVVAQEYAMYEDAVRPEPNLDDIDDMSVTEYKSLLMKARDEARAAIERLPLSRATRELLMLDADYEVMENMALAPVNIARAMLEKGKIARNRYGDAIDSIGKTIPADYIPRELAVQANKPQGVLAPSYTGIIGSYEKERIAPRLDTDSGTFFIMNDAEELYRSVVNDFTPLDEGRKARLATLPESYRTIINDKNDALLKALEEKKAKSGYAVCDVPDVAGNMIVDSIAARYRGKVVLVDVWETWCGPCRIGHQKMAPMKKDFAGKDVVFVYLASESSPEATWKYMIADIPGEHYRLSKEQAVAVRKQFDISGVPTYIIFDRSGRKSFQATGFPGVEKLKKEINKNM